MTFDDLVARLVSLYDVGTVRAAAVANERLASMVGQAKSLRGLVSLGTTVAGTATYALPSTVVEVFRVEIAYAAGAVTYQGTESLDALLDLQRGAAWGDCGNWYAVAPDADATMNTDNLLLSAAPTEAGAAITGRCAILPAVITYGAVSALPIPLDLHRHLLAGCRADILDEDSRQDESAKLEVVYQAGIKALTAREKSRGKGSDGHRMRVSGYDYSQGY